MNIDRAGRWNILSLVSGRRDTVTKSDSLLPDAGYLNILPRA